MKRISVCLTLIFLQIGINVIAQDGFVLNGYVKGYEGKTRLIINKILPTHKADMINEEIIYMIDGKFKLEGKVDEPTKYSIRIRPEDISDDNPNRGEDVFFFAENKAMVLTGEKGNFHYSHVTGSAIQDQQEECLKYVQTKLKENANSEDNRWELEHKYYLEFTSLHPDYFFSVYKYSWYVKWGPEMTPKAEAIKFYNMLDETLQTSIYGQQIKHYIDNITIGEKLNSEDKAYNFSLPDSSGNKISLKSLKGRVVLIDFWFSACAACRIENKNYQAIYQKYRDQGFEILSVSIDRDKNNWIKAMKADNMTWKSVLDADSEVTINKYLVSSFPTTYLLDPKGTIIAKNLRAEGLESKLEELLGVQ